MSREPDPTPHDSIGDIEEFLDRKRVAQDIPGLSVALFDRDDVFHAIGMGAREIESQSPATADTRYSIASVTKVFTAVAVLQQVERDVLSLDDEIREYVNFWTDVPGDPITVAELLSHSSGMPTDYAGSRELLFADAPPTSPILTRADDRRHANGAADRRLPDHETYMYSNRGYQILGEIVEAVTDTDFAEYVEAEIFAPLGMDRSQVGYGELSTLGEDTAMGYVIEDGEPVANSHDLNAEIRTPHSGGGILSSVRDLATFGRCLLSDGSLDETELLSPESIAGMEAYQSPTFETIDGRAIGYGYGLRIQ
ncbi:MAG: serine hydrolase domain-containing protein [Halopenitus sp.]